MSPRTGGPGDPRLERRLPVLVGGEHGDALPRCWDRQNLPSDLTGTIGFGVDVDVEIAGQQVGHVLFGNDGGSLLRAAGLERDDHRARRPGGRDVDVRRDFGRREAAELDAIRQFTSLRIVGEASGAARIGRDVLRRRNLLIGGEGCFQRDGGGRMHARDADHVHGLGHRVVDADPNGVPGRFGLELHVSGELRLRARVREIELNLLFHDVAVLADARNGAGEDDLSPGDLTSTAKPATSATAPAPFGRLPPRPVSILSVPFPPPFVVIEPRSCRTPSASIRQTEYAV